MSNPYLLRPYFMEGFTSMDSSPTDNESYNNKNVCQLETPILKTTVLTETTGPY